MLSQWPLSSLAIPYLRPLSKVPSLRAIEDTEASLIDFQCLGKQDIKCSQLGRSQSFEIAFSSKTRQPIKLPGVLDSDNIDRQYWAVCTFQTALSDPFGNAASTRRSAALSSWIVLSSSVADDGESSSRRKLGNFANPRALCGEHR